MSEVGVVLLRGVNVGGHRKLPMADLRALLTFLGARDVRTYIQSGNAVYRGALSAEAIAAGIETRFGFRPHVLSLSRAAYEARLAANPFPELERAAVEVPKILHVFFLGGAPEPLSDDILALARHGERVALVPGAAYLHAPEGIGRSKLADRLERALGVPATARNWKTAVALRNLCAELAQ